MPKIHLKNVALACELWDVALRDFADILDSHPPQSLAEAVQLEHVASAALTAIDEWLEDQRYLQVVYPAVEKAFGADTPMQLHRFAVLQEQIVLEYLAGQIPCQQVKTAIMAEIRPLTAMLRLNVPPSNSAPGGQVHKHLAIMERAVQTAVMQKVLHPLECGGFISCAPDDFLLEERPEVEQKRAQLMMRLEDLHHAHAVISTIEHQVDASTCGQGPSTGAHLECPRTSNRHDWTVSLCSHVVP